MRRTGRQYPSPRRLALVDRGGWIRLFLFLHVLGAVSALGPTLTYGLWGRRAEAEGGAVRTFTLRTISWVDRRLATPSYVAQLATGLILVWLLRLDLLGTSWLVAALVLYAALVAFAVAVYAPTFRRQTELAARLERDPSVADAYRAMAARANGYGAIALLLTLAILFLMVVKPALW